MSSKVKSSGFRTSSKAKSEGNNGLRYLLPKDQVITFKMVSDAQSSLGYSDCFDDQNCCGAVVSFEDITKRHSLECCRFDYTLKQWLDKNTVEKDGAKTKNGRHNIVLGVGNSNIQPSDEARKIIRGILCAYSKVFNSTSYHGSLDDPDNYLISLGKNHNHFSHDSMKVHVRFRFKNPSKRVDSGNIMVEQNYDRHCIRNVIFGEILESDHSIYNQEWQDLHKSLTIFDHDWRYLANHVSLWHWKERFDFFIKLSTWVHYGNEKVESRSFNMDILLRQHLPQYLNWNTNILPNFVGSPLLKFLSASASSYNCSGLDLIRFIRNVYQHITDKGKDGKYLYIDEHLDWAEEEVTEHEVSKVFPKLLLELTAELSAVNFFHI